MKRTVCLSLILLSAALLVCAGCHSSNSGSPRVKPSQLADELLSGKSLKDVEEKLNMADNSFDIVMQRDPLPSDTRPPYRLLVISKKNAKVAEQAGELVMTFFNDRLMATQFYAADMKAARAAVERQQGISLSDGQAHIAPSTRVWVGKDENRRGYIGWIDKVLQTEQDTWLRQYER